MAGDFGDAMAGSVQAQATVDGILELYRDRNLQKTERKVTFTGRDWPDFEDEVVSLDTTSLTWQAVGKYSDARDAAGEVRKQGDAAVALEALPDCPPGLTYAEWEATTGFGRTKLGTIRKTLGEQVGQGGKPRSPSDPLRFWKMPLE